MLSVLRSATSEGAASLAAAFPAPSFEREQDCGRRVHYTESNDKGNRRTVARRGSHQNTHPKAPRNRRSASAAFRHARSHRGADVCRTQARAQQQPRQYSAHPLSIICDTDIRKAGLLADLATAIVLRTTSKPRFAFILTLRGDEPQAFKLPGLSARMARNTRSRDWSPSSIGCSARTGHCDGHFASGRNGSVAHRRCAWVPPEQLGPIGEVVAKLDAHVKGDRRAFLGAGW